MKTTSIVSLVTAVCTTLALAADGDPTVKQLQVFPKNFARQHLGANLFVFNPANQTFVPTEAAAAWLDDDITTGWPVAAGKQNYLIALPEPEMISNFSVSSRPAEGTISIFAGDELAAPGAKSWTALAQNVAFDSVNQKKLTKPFSRFAKYVLIQTDLADPGPLFSLYLYGERPAVDYNLRKRETAIDARAIFGQYVNSKTAFNLNGLYAQARISSANSPDGFLPWQKGLDDNPESSLTLSASKGESGAVIAYNGVQSVSRIALLADGSPKGTLEFFAINDADVSAVASASVPGAKPVSLEGSVPTTKIVFDGSNSRSNVEFAAIPATKLAVRWTPQNAADTLTIREINTFGAFSMNDYEVGLKPEVVAGYSGAGGKDYKAIAEGPLDPKDPKNVPIAAAPPGSPYLPGSLGFPPNLNGVKTPNIPTPASP
ncbi:MAG: hypothetical protein K8R23_02075 [Chthoniobacter sp.]|nr:hypothetical protein [Chthoniobacter sp.]